MCLENRRLVYYFCYALDWYFWSIDFSYANVMATVAPIDLLRAFDIYEGNI